VSDTEDFVIEWMCLHKSHPTLGDLHIFIIMEVDLEKFKDCEDTWHSFPIIIPLRGEVFSEVK